ncbi:hypothetical protein ACFQE5_01815 [Pseudonocardia hispaniensis]|uniref:Uncharacterized protein n=1 Tax=Pseudonocardia hispaniensis TaxID=904933 RepID=A0ABW1IWY5_9PSEU
MALITSRGGGCPVCGAPHAACGPATTTVGVDERIEEMVMSELREYHVTVNGHDTVMNLNEQDAARLGGTPVDAASASAGPEEKARAAANKSRPAATKSSG